MKKRGNWIKLYRDLLDNPTVMKDGDHLAVWVWLLMNATSKRRSVIFDGKQIYLEPGQLTTGRKIIASELLISQSKVQRILKTFEIEHQIEQLTDFRCRLITIVNWDEYQQSEQPNEQVVNRFRTGSEQVLNTKQEYKNRKNRESVAQPPTLAEVSKYVQEQGYEMDPEAFFDYYEETNWTKKNGQPIKDWKASVRTWARREREFKKAQSGKYGKGTEPEIRPKHYREFEAEPEVDAVQMPDEIRDRIKEIFSS